MSTSHGVHGVHEHSMSSLSSTAHGLHVECRKYSHGVLMECSWIAHTAHGVLMECSWIAHTAHGVLMECSWSPWEGVGECKVLTHLITFKLRTSYHLLNASI